MKRHPALQDLSRDHFQVLVRTQRLRRALAGPAPWPEVRETVDELLRFYESDMRPHFEEEDRFVAPLGHRRGSPVLERAATELVAEHRTFRAQFERLRLVREDAAATRSLLTGLEPRITAHVHREEEELFEGLQRVLAESELEAMWARSYAFRSMHRAADACSVRPPARA